MKTIFYLFLLFSEFAFSQDVTLADLLILQSKTPTEIRQYFIDANWKLIDERYSEQRNFGDMTFASTDTPEPKTMRLTIFYGQGKPEQTRLVLKLKDKGQFSAIKSGLATSGMKFASTEVNGNITTTIFKSDTITLTILATRPVGNISEYEVSIVSNAYDPKMYNFSLGK